MRGSVYLVLLLIWRQESVDSIRLIELRVPGHAAAGGEALLGCQFDLEGDLLYSVKWYKDGREFYRYMPRGANQTLRFLRPGVTVDLSRSSSDVVTLTRLTPDSAGLYRCEVSGEKPLFATAHSDKYITIHVLPKNGPRITGLRYQYKIGDRVVANCTSPGSRPEAQVKWLVNNRPATRGYLRGPWHRVVYDPPDTIDTTVGLNFMVLPSHYKTGVMEIKCQATIAPLYQREKVYVLSQPEMTEEPYEPDPEEETPDLSEKEIRENVINSFREMSNTIHLELPGLVPTTTDEPSEGTENKAYATLSEKSIAAVVLTLLLHMILLL